MELRTCTLLLALLAAGLGRAAPAVAEDAPAAAGGAAVVDADVAAQIRGNVASAVALPGGGQARVELEVGKLDPRLRLAPCKRVETRLPPAAQLWGRSRIGLRCAEGEKNWQVYLPITVRVFAPAQVPRQNLPAGTTIAAEMLQVTEVDWALEAGLPFSGTQGLIGRTTTRPVAAGTPLRAGDLRQRQFFAAGDTVVLWARGDGFTVSGEGQALTAGLEGQTVRVRTESGRVLSGTPVGERRVEVGL